MQPPCAGLACDHSVIFDAGIAFHIQCTYIASHCALQQHVKAKVKVNAVVYSLVIYVNVFNGPYFYVPGGLCYLASDPNCVFGGAYRGLTLL